MPIETQLSAFQQPLLPPKFSRYRSVRQAHGTDATVSPALPSRVATARQDASVERSPSRYHRKVKSADTTAGTVAGQRVLRAAPLHSHSASLAALTGEPCLASTTQEARNNSVKTVSNNNALASIPNRNKSSVRPAHRQDHSPPVNSEQVPETAQSCISTNPPVLPVATSEVELNEEARQKLRAERERIRRIKAKQNAAREFERSQRVVSAEMTPSGGHANIEGDALKANVSTSQDTDPTLGVKRDGRAPGPVLDEAENVSQNNVRIAAKGETKSHELQNRRVHAPTAPEVFPASVETISPRRKLTRPIQTAPTHPKQELNVSMETKSSKPCQSSLKTSDPGPITSSIPRSAVNAGERRVVIKYNETVISLPVTPTTTSQDLLNSTSATNSSPLDPQQSILLESFTQLGLQRPLRKYERVRDIMNSWDHDTQNHFIVMPMSVNILSKGDVDPKALPQQPGGTSLYMYHSQRPGKWDKRWVSLKEDGQISISKRQDGSEASSLCHLSDFDIYKPTQRQMKKLRPPKKACFAIKSQQKSVMFLDGANFVHFFATGEGPLTDTWYGAVRTWRSWYLVNVLGEGQKQQNSQISIMGRSAGARMMASKMTEQDRPISPKQGQQSTSRLLKMGSPTKSISKASAPEAMQNRGLREVSQRGRSAPPSSFPSYQIHQSDPTANAFVPKRTPSLSRSDKKANSMRSDVEAPSSLRRSTSLSRAGSIRNAPKPLIDLTPQFQEQPQHLRKGRGVAPVRGKPLVELATDVEALPGAITIPAARAWQRPPDPLLGDTASVATAMKSPRGFAAELPGDNAALTGTGLLGRSKSRRTQGGIGHGFGLKTGDRNHIGEPLVDLRTESQFTDGSLLRRVETLNGKGERGLMLDREKRTEKNVAVGEGV